MAWSPDSRWVAYLGLSAKSFRNVYRGPRGRRREPRGQRACPTATPTTSRGVPDGTYIIFNTNQRTEEGQVVRVDLILRTPRFREDRFRDLFKDEPSRRAPGERQAARRAPDRERDAEPARDPSKPVEIVFDDIRRRLSTPAGRRRRRQRRRSVPTAGRCC